MKALNKSSEAIFAKLISGLDVGRSHKLDNAPGTFLPVHVERLSDSTYSVAHYVEQGGDLMADPDVVFYVPVEARYGAATAGSQVYPVEITQAPVGIYNRYVEFDETGQPARINARGQADLTSFSNTWMRNIRAQQMTGRQNMREQHELTGPGTDGLYRYRGASIELSGIGTRHWWATVRFRSQEIDFEAQSSDEALEKAKEWIDSAPEFRGRHTPAPDDYGRPYPRETHPKDPFREARERYDSYVLAALVRFGMSSERASDLMRDNEALLLMAYEHYADADHVADRLWRAAGKPTKHGTRSRYSEEARPRHQRAMISSQDTAKAERIIRSAAAAKFGRGRADLFFEHDQWFATVGSRSYSVVDAIPGVNRLGIDFEPLG
jgi:hypothetical protein